MKAFQGILVLVILPIFAALFCWGAEPGVTLVFAGSHDSSKAAGIQVFKLQTSNLEVSQNITLAPLGLGAETPNPSYFEVDSKRRLLFTVNEVVEGTVTSFSIGVDGKLSALNQTASLGASPCYLALDREGANLLVVNCGSGSVALIPIAPDGKLGAAVVVHKTGARSVAFDPANRFAFVCERDRVSVYRYDGAQARLSPADAAFVAVKAGREPYRIAFRPDGRFAYVVNGKESSVTTYSYDAQAGRLQEGATETTLPGYYDGPNAAAEIGMHPSGRFLYVSNRGHNSVVLLGIDAATGALSYVEEQGTGGKNPVHFGIQASAQHLAIANRDSNTLLASRIDAENGRLKPSGLFAAMAAPTCVRFLAPAK